MRPASKTQIRKQLKALGFVRDHDDDYFKARGLRARIVNKTHPVYGGKDGKSKEYAEEQILTLQISNNKTFDRWANSVDFEVRFNYSNAKFLNLKQVVQMARKIIRSKIFDFNAYFHAIPLDPH